MTVVSIASMTSRAPLADAIACTLPCLDPVTHYGKISRALIGYVYDENKVLSLGFT